MKKNSRTLHTLLIGALLAAFIAPVTGGTAYAAGSSTGVIDVGGGSGPGLVGKTYSRDEGGKGTPKCNRKTGGADWNGIPNYLQPVAPGCEGYIWTSEIVKCIVGYDEVRVYGTTAKPVQAATLSRVYNLDWCTQDGQSTARVYLPNPKDAAGTIPLGTVWNAGAPGTTKSVFSVRGEPVSISDYCTTIDDINRCASTSAEPRVMLGDCSTLQVKGDRSLSAVLAKGTDTEKAAIRERVFSQYQATKANTKSSHINALAAANASLPVNGLSAAAYGSAGQINTISSGYDCSSVFDFIPATGTPSPENTAQMGSCISPIYLPARKYVKPGDPSDVKYAFWGVWSNSVNIPRYLNVPVKVYSLSSAYDSSLIAEIDSTTAKNLYGSTVKRLVAADNQGSYVGGEYDEVMRTGGYFFPSKAIITSGIEAMMYRASVAEAKRTLTAAVSATDAAEYAKCFGISLAPTLGVPPTPRPSPSPSSTTVVTTTPEEPVPSGPVRVEVTVNAPKIYTVGGTSRPHDVKVTRVDIMCGSRPCDGRESDPRVSTPNGQLVLRGVNGYTDCSSSTQRGCGLYVMRTNGAGTMANRALTASFFSPTRTSEKARVGVVDASARVVPRKQIVPPRICTTDIVTDVDGKSTSVTSCTQDPPYWVDDVANAYTITAFVIKMADGGPRDRSVSGSIGS